MLYDIHIAFEKLPMGVIIKLILSVAMVGLWIFEFFYITFAISHILEMYCIIECITGHIFF